MSKDDFNFHKNNTLNYVCFFLGFVTLGLTSCSTRSFSVAQFHLRGEGSIKNSAEFVRGEALYRFGKSVSTLERQARHGHYYTFQWSMDLLKDRGGQVEGILYYRQANTGRMVLSKSFIVPAGQKKAELSVHGREYAENGRVLNWRGTLTQGGELLASEQSFLWE